MHTAGYAVRIVQFPVQLVFPRTLVRKVKAVHVVDSSLLMTFVHYVVYVLVLRKALLANLVWFPEQLFLLGFNLNPIGRDQQLPPILLDVGQLVSLNRNH